jgi:DNA helicase II / ATP-dependent DNA helicase PcrA
LLAYLHCVDNPEFTPAFSRAINVPSRGIGEKVMCSDILESWLIYFNFKTLREISLRAEKINVYPLEVIEKIHDSTIPDIQPPIKRKLFSFVQTIRELRRLANKVSAVDVFFPIG